MTVALTWRGAVANEELNALHAGGFGHPSSMMTGKANSLATASGGWWLVMASISWGSSTWRGMAVSMLVYLTRLSRCPTAAAVLGGLSCKPPSRVSRSLAAKGSTWTGTGNSTGSTSVRVASRRRPQVFMRCPDSER